MGYYCCIALQHQKSVIAFEPVESNLHYLYKNLKANNWEQDIEIYPIALANRTGVAEIRGVGAFASLISGWAGQVDSIERNVPTSTLDRVLASRLSGKRCFVLVDIEGSEELMLQGARSFLSMSPRPIWLVEIQLSDHQPKGIVVNPNILGTFERFWGSGYDAWTAGSNIRVVDRGEIEHIQQGGPDTLRTNNFLFIERGKSLESL